MATCGLCGISLLAKDVIPHLRDLHPVEMTDIIDLDPDAYFDLDIPIIDRTDAP